MFFGVNVCVRERLCVRWSGFVKQSSGRSVRAALVDQIYTFVIFLQTRLFPPPPPPPAPRL